MATLFYPALPPINGAPPRLPNFRPPGEGIPELIGQVPLVPLIWPQEVLISPEEDQRLKEEEIAEDNCLEMEKRRGKWTLKTLWDRFPDEKSYYHTSWEVDPFWEMIDRMYSQLREAWGLDPESEIIPTEVESDAIIWFKHYMPELLVKLKETVRDEGAEPWLEVTGLSPAYIRSLAN